MKGLREVRIACLGSGIMGGLLIERLVTAKAVDPGVIVACDPDQDRLQALAGRLGVRTSTDNQAGADADVVLVAVPPPAVVPVLQEIRESIGSEQLIVSVAAGVTIETMQRELPDDAQIVRVMPNTPSQVGRGMNVFVCSDSVTPAARALLQEMLDVWGDSLEVSEEVINAACALLAVGPTFLFPVAATLMAAATDAGLEPAQARRIAGRLFEGVGAMLVESELDVEALKNMISLQTLDEEGAAGLFRSAYQEALAKLNGMQDKLSG